VSEANLNLPPLKAKKTFAGGDKKLVSLKIAGPQAHSAKQTLPGRGKKKYFFNNHARQGKAPL